MPIRGAKLALLPVVMVTVALFFGSCAAQQPSTRIGGVSIPAVPGVPFSATVVIEAERYWPYEFTETYRTINLIGRDSLGRTHNETRQLMPEAFHGSPALQSVSLYDPRSHVRIVCDPDTHVARRSTVPDPGANPGVVPEPTRTEDLGTATMNGLTVKGTRRIYSLSKKESGTGHPIDVVDEVWHSDDLHLDLLQRHDDPRFGTNTIGISSLKREEPPTSLFDVPTGYQILTAAPPAPGSDRTATPKP